MAEFTWFNLLHISEVPGDMSLWVIKRECWNKELGFMVRMVGGFVSPILTSGRFKPFEASVEWNLVVMSYYYICVISWNLWGFSMNLNNLGFHHVSAKGYGGSKIKWILRDFLYSNYRLGTCFVTYRVKYWKNWNQWKSFIQSKKIMNWFISCVL